MKPITIFKGTTGLNTVSDPVRIKSSDLQVAVNISIDSSGRPHERKSSKLLQSGNFHSLFCDGGDCFVVKDGSLYNVASDGSLSGIRSGMNNSRMSYTQVGDRTYYTNSFDLGYIENGVSYVWKKGEYTGPDTTKVFSAPMPGNHLTAFAGRMFISQGNVLWWSEPFNFGLYNQAESFVQFNTKILMLKPVEGGLFVSTEKNIYFLTGLNPKGWQVNKIANYPAVEWSDSIEYVSATDLGFDTVGMCALWVTPEGAILGLPTGRIINLNKKKIIYPDNAKTGFGGLIGLNFIHGVE